MIRAKLILKPMALSLLLASSVATAQSKDQDSYFLLGETAVGKAIKEATGATIFGLAQVGYSRNDVTSSSDKNKSRSNTIAGPSDEGAQFNGMILGIENYLKPISCLESRLCQDQCLSNILGASAQICTMVEML